MRFKGLLIGLLVIFIVIIYFQYVNNKKLQEHNQQESNLNGAILDSLHTYYDKLTGELITEKKTLQTSVENLKKINSELYQKVKKNDRIIANAIINSNVIIDTIVNYKPDTSNSTLVFSDSTKYISYNITVKNDTLKLNSLNIPNDLYIQYEYDKDNAISFSVINSNPYVITENLTSYIIPAIAPPEKKFKKFIKKTGRVLMIGLSGVLIGLMI